MTSAGIVPPDAPLNALDPTVASAFEIAGMQSTYAAFDVLVESSVSACIEIEDAGTFHMQNHARVRVAVCGNLTGRPELSDAISNQQLQVVYTARPGAQVASIMPPTNGTIAGKSPIHYGTTSNWGQRHIRATYISQSVDHQF
jgi:hypothetical protein